MFIVPTTILSTKYRSLDSKGGIISSAMDVVKSGPLLANLEYFLPFQHP
jgi:hypothetical protein